MQGSQSDAEYTQEDIPKHEWKVTIFMNRPAKGQVRWNKRETELNQTTLQIISK